MVSGARLITYEILSLCCSEDYRLKLINTEEQDSAAHPGHMVSVTEIPLIIKTFLGNQIVDYYWRMERIQIQ